MWTSRWGGGKCMVFSVRMVPASRRLSRFCPASLSRNPARASPSTGAPRRCRCRPGGFREHGISFVHQNLGLVPSLTVLENLLASDLATESRWRINWRKEAGRAEELFHQYHLLIDPIAPVSRLTPVQRALLAIVRAFDQLQRTRRHAESPGLLVSRRAYALPARQRCRATVQPGTRHRHRRRQCRVCLP